MKMAEIKSLASFGLPRHHSWLGISNAEFPHFAETMDGLYEEQEVFRLAKGDYVGKFLVFKDKKAECRKFVRFSNEETISRITEIEDFRAETEPWQELLNDVALEGVMLSRRKPHLNARRKKDGDTFKVSPALHFQAEGFSLSHEFVKSVFPPLCPESAQQGREGR